LHPVLTWLPPQRWALRREVRYQIQVAESPAALRHERDLTWNSGHVLESSAFLPQYDGKMFRPYQRYYWRVRVWSRSGWQSAWSRVASWMTGPLSTEDWHGSWISYRHRIRNPFYESPHNAYYGLPLPRWMGRLDKADWIFCGGVAAPGSFNVPPGLYEFSRTFKLPMGVKFRRSYLTIAADNGCNVAINGIIVATGFGAPWNHPAMINVTSALRGGQNRITVLLKNDGHHANPAGLIAELTARVSDRFKRSLVTDTRWQARISHGGAHWATETPRGKKAVDVAKWGSGPWGKISTLKPNWVQKEPNPIFRRVFRTPANFKAAYMFLASPDYWIVRINGRKVGPGELESTLYDYAKAVPYQSFNVTALLKPGKTNVMSIELGNGWGNFMEPNPGNYQHAVWRAWPSVRMNLLMRQSDGRSKWLATNNTWQAASGPYLADGIYNGEVYDAALNIHGWNNPDQKLTQLDHAEILKGPMGRLTTQLMPPCEVMQRLKPVSIREPQRHVFVVKFPQNMSGWVTLTAKGRAGVPVVLQYAELLKPNGLINQTPISSQALAGPFQTDVYIPASDKPFTYHPEFAYNGFQYVQIRGLNAKKDILRIQADFIHTAFHRIGTFWSSNPLLNAIADATSRSYCSNFMGYPTDCPQREKNGWTGDAWLGAVSGVMTYGNQLGYAKWLDDISDTQFANGRLLVVMPNPSGWDWDGGKYPDPDWESAYEFICWYQYLYYGDGQILRAHYDGLKRYFHFVMTYANHDILPNGAGIGDWASPAKHRPSTSFSSTCILYHDAKLLAKIARVLDKRKDAALFNADALAIRRAFNQRFYKGHGVYENGGQTAEAMPLYYRIVPRDTCPLVLHQLVHAVHQHQDHLDVGVLGDKCLFRVLSRYRHAAMAYRMVTQTTYPSYGQWILHGATTLWEAWGARPLVSHNHIMFGDILGWMYNDLAGIQPDWRSPGFRTILITPHPVEGLSWVRAERYSRFGIIRSAWKWQVGKLVMTFTIPPATSAMITLAGASGTHVQCNGKPLTPGRGGVSRVAPSVHDKRAMIMYVRPGTYRLIYRPLGLRH
jgi:alpha-L-rhamnosidase